VRIDPRAAGAPEYPAVVDRICPFLALGDDHRTVIDGFDPAHACHARHPAVPVDRARQAELCLEEAHRECEFYASYLAERAAGAATFPMPSADSHVARTRLVLEPEPWRPRLPGEAPFGMSARRWLVAGGIAAVGVAAAATAVGGGFNGLVAGPPGGLSPSQSPPASSPPVSGSSDATPLPRPSASEETTQPTPTSTPMNASSATPRPETPAPTRRTYVVAAGDTLSLIATRYGTSVSAIQAANGLGNSDVINVGQVLVIP